MIAVLISLEEILQAFWSTMHSVPKAHKISNESAYKEKMLPYRPNVNFY